MPEKYIHKILSDLKDRIVITKFKPGQDVYVKQYDGQIILGKIYEVQTNKRIDGDPLISYLIQYSGSYSEDEADDDFFDESDVFETIEEAKKKSNIKNRSI